MKEVNATDYIYRGETSSFFTNGSTYKIESIGQGESKTTDDAGGEHELGFDYLNKNFVTVFTQSMSDNGELPLVGMECNFDTTFFTTHTSNKGTCEIIAYFDGKVWINIIDFDCVINLNIIEFAPLTPPIELIDGKAYQFDVEGVSFLGFYQLERKSFFDSNHNGNKVCGENQANNIQLLEVVK